MTEKKERQVLHSEIESWLEQNVSLNFKTSAITAWLLIIICLAGAIYKACT